MGLISVAKMRHLIIDTVKEKYDNVFYYYLFNFLCCELQIKSDYKFIHLKDIN